MRSARSSLQAIACALLICPLCMAQVATSRIQGMVQDVSGAVITGAMVSVEEIRTNTKYELRTGSDGFFTFPSLQPGNYTLTAEAAGFHRNVTANLRLNVGDTITQCVTLKLGSITEEVVVESRTEHVQVSDAQVVRVIPLKEIGSLPLLGRSPIALSLFAPGIQMDPSDPTVSRVNGTRQGSTNSRTDGIDANDSLTPRFSNSCQIVTIPTSAMG
jgi:hypothetical protein